MLRKKEGIIVVSRIVCQEIAIEANSAERPTQKRKKKEDEEKTPKTLGIFRYRARRDKAAEARRVS